ncbi:MAG TPA: hypothetical protein VMT79_10290 [Candidatus Binatia bacterium]|nr:hypothetical protein [Candidatus Binatia bacterium]
MNALVTQAMIARAPGLVPLFTGLRYRLETESDPDVPKRPLTTIAFSGLPSFRPADDLILAATSFSGVPAFVEVIDSDALSRFDDPLKTRMQELLC